MALIERRIDVVMKKSYLIGKVIDGVTAKIDFGPLRWLAKRLLRDDVA